MRKSLSDDKTIGSVYTGCPDMVVSLNMFVDIKNRVLRFTGYQATFLEQKVVMSNLS